MNKKVLPSETMSKALADLIQGNETAEDLLSELMRRSLEHMLQQSLEAEVSDFLGRGHYERAEDPDAHSGYRNGYQDKRLKTSEGTVHVRKPRVREQPFESRILARIDALEDRLVKLALEMYVRGLSTRDIEATLVDEDGQALLSRSSVSRLSEALFAEYEAFTQRDLSSYDVVYLFVDGVYEAVRRYTNNQAILCAWGICSNGEKVLLHLGCVASESEDAWSSFFEEMLTRGLAQPLLVVSDGAPGLIAAIKRHFPRSDRQRCLAHKQRNLAAKLSNEHREAVLSQARAVYYAPDLETGRLLAERFIEDYTDAFPAAVKCFCDDLEAALAQLKYPLGHRKFIRTTNMLERAFVEEKRRTKIIPQHMNERGAIKLVYGVLIRASRKWRRVSMKPLELAQLRKIRKLICKDDDHENRISFRLAA